MRRGCGQKYLDGKESMYSIANRFGIDVSAVRLWVNKYRAMGVDAFSTNQNKHYTKEEKEQAVAPVAEMWPGIFVSMSKI